MAGPGPAGGPGALPGADLPLATAPNLSEQRLLLLERRMIGMLSMPSPTPPPPSGASLPASGSRPAAPAPAPPAAAAPPAATASPRGGSPLKNVVAAPDPRVVIDVDADSTRSTAGVEDDSDDGDGFSDMEEDELESSSEDEPIVTSKPPTDVVRTAVPGPSRARRPHANHESSLILVGGRSTGLRSGRQANGGASGRAGGCSGSRSTGWCAPDHSARDGQTGRRGLVEWPALAQAVRIYDRRRPGTQGVDAV